MHYRSLMVYDASRNARKSQGEQNPIFSRKKVRFGGRSRSRMIDRDIATKPSSLFAMV